MSMLYWLFPEASLKVNMALVNIQGTLTPLHNISLAIVGDAVWSVKSFAKIEIRKRNFSNIMTVFEVSIIAGGRRDHQVEN